MKTVNLLLLVTFGMTGCAALSDKDIEELKEICELDGGNPQTVNGEFFCIYAEGPLWLCNSTWFGTTHCEQRAVDESD